MKINEKGLGALTAFLVFIVIALAAAVGLLVYDRQKKVEVNNNAKSIENIDNKDNMSAVANSNSNEKQNSNNIFSNKYFSITLPEKWVESSEFIKIVADDKFIYENKNEDKKIVVLVNPGGFGVASDSIKYQVANSRVDLDINSLIRCTEEPPCSVIKDRLNLTVYPKDTEATVNGNKYIFLYEDNKSDSTVSLNLLKIILASMQFK